VRQAVNRRAMLGALARWSAPAVVSVALSGRALEAKASCPPCQKRQGTLCRPCSVRDILQCQCEPCLGAPYCAAPLMAGPSASYQAPGSQPFGAGGPGGAQRVEALRQLQRERARRRGDDPLSQPLYRDPFGVERRDPRRSYAPSLYERLQQTPERRRP